MNETINVLRNNLFIRQTTIIYFVILIFSSYFVHGDVVLRSHFNPNNKFVHRSNLARISSVSVSGLSGGGFMATQVHVAFSKSVIGVGVIAGGPFLCAQAQLDIAMSSCMKGVPALPIEVFTSETINMAATGLIDDPRNMKNHRIFLFSGTKDSVVNQSVMLSTLDYYAFFTNTTKSDNIKAVFDTPAQHAMITLDYGNSCDHLGSPYISHCDPPYKRSLAHDLLQHLYPKLIAPKPGHWNKANLFEFDQFQFIPELWGFGRKGFIYIPSSCLNNSTICSIHINFHGCHQGYTEIGDIYVANTGFNEVAEANNIIVIYPQIQASTIPLYNPNGCFDWWGYTSGPMDPLYATKDGIQMKAVKKMAQHFGATFFN